jgi:hypothetical protein
MLMANARFSCAECGPGQKATLAMILFSPQLGACIQKRYRRLIIICKRLLFLFNGGDKGLDVSDNDGISDLELFIALVISVIKIY